LKIGDKFLNSLIPLPGSVTVMPFFWLFNSLDGYSLLIPYPAVGWKFGNIRVMFPVFQLIEKRKERRIILGELNNICDRSRFYRD